MVKAGTLLVRVEEAGRMLSLSRSTIYEMVAAGELKPVKFGRSVRIQVADLEDWVKRQMALAS